MKIRLVVFMLIIGVVVSSTAGADCLKEFCLESERGSQKCSSEFDGKLLLADFWTSWCSNCRDSLKWLGELRDQFSPAELSIVAVNLDQHRSDVERLLQIISPRVDVLFDSKGITAETCALTSIPSLVLIRSDDRHIVRKWVGQKEEDRQEILSLIEELSKEYEE